MFTEDPFPADAVLDAEELATLQKTPCNTTPVSCPSQFAEVMHMDIVIGPAIS